MSVYTIKSPGDLENLQKLAENKQKAFETQLENKIEKQTFDEDLAKQYKPITDTIKQNTESLKALPESMNNNIILFENPALTSRWK